MSKEKPLYIRLPLRQTLYPLIKYVGIGLSNTGNVSSHFCLSRKKLNSITQIYSRNANKLTCEMVDKWHIHLGKKRCLFDWFWHRNGTGQNTGRISCVTLWT